MKIALYIEDGLEQIVLTPDSETEKSLLEKLHADRDITIHKNSFFRTVGGFVRQGADNHSTIIVMTPGKKDSKIQVSK